MKNLQNICYEMLGRMNEDQYKSYTEIHENILRKKGKPLESYDEFNLAAKILTYRKTVNKVTH